MFRSFVYQTANPSPNNDLPEPWTANWSSISQLCITTGYRNREGVRIKREGRIDKEWSYKRGREVWRGRKTNKRQEVRKEMNEGKRKEEIMVIFCCYGYYCIP